MNVVVSAGSLVLPHFVLWPTAQTKNTTTPCHSVWLFPSRSLGSTKSLIFYIPTDDILRSSFQLSGADETAYRDWAGEGVFRLSVGLEDADDLIADLAQGLG